MNIRHGNNEKGRREGRGKRLVTVAGSVFLVSLSMSGSCVALRICNHRNSRDKRCKYTMG